jgi:transaldolase
MTARADPSSRPGLRLFLDSADRAAWAHWLPTGLFFGVTTNPTILDAAGLRCTLPVIADLVRDALAHGIEELQVQSWGTETGNLVRHGLAVAALSPRVVIKVPVTLEGVRAVAELHRAGVRTTLTAVYAAHQALTGAAAGADYVAPYFGRIGDLGRDAPAEIGRMRAILQASGGRTRLLVASIRSADDLAVLAASGIDTFTFGTTVAEALFAVEGTITASSQFEATAAGVR